ncbi:hypothetical protein [Methylobacterium sp. WL7]|uniref:hypothetical protein n=1 Tax=Methylobacterium sp. WL7 TaxID=2603900 RepID=UPI0011CA5C80|nr:hypothetical protein [Methylobacterium sp. WL7]TXN42631.1 hypothetical protein FV233_21830 [Methylobacterium sp. WL7]
MLSPDDLKLVLQRDGLSRADKVLLVIASLGQPVKNPAIVAQAQEAGCNMKTWNIADVLTKARDTTLRLPGGYEVSEKGHARLEELGVSKLPTAAAKVAQDLRKHLASIKDDTTRAFVAEAIQCHEAALYRSAIVMSWLAAVGVMHNEVVTNHLAAFNTEAKKVDGKWKIAVTTDDLGRMKENDFLDRIAAVGMVGKNVKAQLAAGLNLRNGCGHPNSLKVGANAVAAHIEMLLLNVFDKFAT